MNELAEQTQQLNIKLPWALVAGVKRLAAKQGVALNTYVAAMFSERIREEAGALRAQIEAEQAEVMREHEALMEALEVDELANEEKSKHVLKR